MAAPASPAARAASCSLSSCIIEVTRAFAERPDELHHVFQQVHITAAAAAALHMFPSPESAKQIETR